MQVDLGLEGWVGFEQVDIIGEDILSVNNMQLGNYD